MDAVAANGPPPDQAAPDLAELAATVAALAARVAELERGARRRGDAVEGGGEVSAARDAAPGRAEVVPFGEWWRHDAAAPKEAAGAEGDEDGLPVAFGDFLRDYLAEGGSASVGRRGEEGAAEEASCIVAPAADFCASDASPPGRSPPDASVSPRRMPGMSSEDACKLGSTISRRSTTSLAKDAVRSWANRASVVLNSISLMSFGQSSASLSSEVDLDISFSEDQPCELGHSIWDVALLAGCKHISKPDSALIIVLMVLNIMAQAVFLGIVYYIFTEQKFTDRFQEQLVEWRTHVGHNVMYYDPFTFSSLTERVCQPDKHTPELSSYISDQVTKMHTFLDKGNVVFNGSTLLIVAVFCWSLTIMREITNAWNISRAARALPRARTRIVQPRNSDSRVCRLASISRRRKLWWDAIVVMRISCAIVLWGLGCRFLCSYSITPEAVLLDVVALEVVLSVDEAVFTLAPRSVCEIVERLEPLKAMPRCCRRGRSDLRPFALTAVVIAALGGCSGLMIVPLLERVRTANATICGGAQDFVFTIDPLKVVHYARSNPNSVDVRAAQTFPSYDAIQELWERLDDAESLRLGPPLASQAHALEELKPSDEISMSEASASLQTLSDSACEDILEESPALLRFAETVARWGVSHPDFGWVGVASVSSCADLAPTCPGLALTRALCPATCGCRDPLGGVLAASVAHGCPAACATSPEWAEASRELPCEEAGAEELRSHPTWQAWASQLDVLLAGRYLGGTLLPPVCQGSCEAAMLREGCGIVGVWREALGADPCAGSWTSAEPLKTSRPLAPLCPLACGCRSGNASEAFQGSPACPESCAPRPIATPV